MSLSHFVHRSLATVDISLCVRTEILKIVKLCTIKPLKDGYYVVYTNCLVDSLTWPGVVSDNCDICWKPFTSEVSTTEWGQYSLTNFVISRKRENLWFHLFKPLDTSINWWPNTTHAWLNICVCVWDTMWWCVDVMTHLHDILLRVLLNAA